MFCGHWNPFSALRDRRQRRKNEWGERWQVRVVVVGDSQSGKSCLIQRYSSGTLPSSYTPTLFDTTTVTSDVLDKKVQLIIQDTAGQEDLGNVRSPCYLHADVVVVCFSPGSPGSWERVSSVWVPEVRRYCGKGVPLVLVACKVDPHQGQSLPPPLSPTSPITSPFTSSPPISSSSSPFARSNNGDVDCEEEEEEEGGFSTSVFRRDSTPHHHHHHHPHQRTKNNNNDDDSDDDESASTSDARDSGFFEMSERDRRASNPPASLSSSLQDVSPRVSLSLTSQSQGSCHCQCQSRNASLMTRRERETVDATRPCVQRQTCSGQQTDEEEGEEARTGQCDVRQQDVSCSSGQLSSQDTYSSGHHHQQQQQRGRSEVRQEAVTCSGQQQQQTVVSGCPSGGDQQRGVSVARQVGAAGYFETSAVTDTGIEMAFQSALTAAMAAKQWRKKYRL